jgi:hypothetical protein
MVLGVKWDGRDYIAWVIPDHPRVLLMTLEKDLFVTVEGLGEKEQVAEYEAGVFRKLYPSPCDWLAMKEAKL